MKNQINAYLIIFLFISCSALKDVERNRSKESFNFEETGRVKIERPGDVIILPAPRTPKDRPKDTIITTKGISGTVITTSYDKDGYLSGQIINAPSSKEESQYNLKAEYDLKTLELRRKLDIDIINAIGKWTFLSLISISLILATAWIIKSKIK